MILSRHEQFLIDNCEDQILNLLFESPEKDLSIYINLTVLKQEYDKLYLEFFRDYESSVLKWDKSLLTVQNLVKNTAKNEKFIVKTRINIRFTNLPQVDNILSGGAFPSDEHIGVFVLVEGNVVQINQEKIYEIKRELICSKCKETVVIEGKYGLKYKIENPYHCIASNKCKGIMRPKTSSPKPEYCIRFQQIKLKPLNKTEFGSVGPSLIVCFENNLTNCCKLGETLKVCGNIEVQWNAAKKSKNTHTLTLRASSIMQDDHKKITKENFKEHISKAQNDWRKNVEKSGYFIGRKIILDSMCPEILGMDCLKLGLALSLCSVIGNENEIQNLRRTNSHILFIGDPGMAKSRLLRAASEIHLGAISASGLGCSTAGLTVAAIKEGKEWNLQAGALVLADCGVCCIDQFNLLQDCDKAAVHETMEQQTISVAKAGMVCKLLSRCAIIAAASEHSMTNKKFFSEADGNIKFNIGTPLLSRFDLIFVLKDPRNENDDIDISNYIFKQCYSTRKDIVDFRFLELEEIQSHILAAREIVPDTDENVLIIFGAYYKFYRNFESREVSRTTVRMLESLNRLAQAHAKFMLRRKVLGIDAIVTIHLIEATFGFGKLFQKDNRVFKNYNDTFITNEYISRTLEALGLSILIPSTIKERDDYLSNRSPLGFQIKKSIDFADKPKENSSMILDDVSGSKEVSVSVLNKSDNLTNQVEKQNTLANTSFRNCYSRKSRTSNSNEVLPSQNICLSGCFDFSNTNEIRSYKRKSALEFHIKPKNRFDNSKMKPKGSLKGYSVNSIDNLF